MAGTIACSCEHVNELRRRRPARGANERHASGLETRMPAFTLGKRGRYCQSCANSARGRSRTKLVPPPTRAWNEMCPSMDSARRLQTEVCLGDGLGSMIDDRAV